MKTACVVLASLIVSAAALPAQASTSQRAAADPAARSTIVQDGVTGSSPKLICRRQETTGARTGGEKICLTKEQWRIVRSGGSVTTYQKRVR